MKFTPYLFIALTSSLLITPVSARDLYHANEASLHVSRYVDVLPGPTNAQRNPLHIVLPNVTFSTRIKSVGQAIHYLLKGTGYKLTRFHPDQRVHKMFRLALPRIHRRMGPLTLEQALKTLSGEPWILSVDPINRLISFQLPSEYIKPLLISTPVRVSSISTKPEIKRKKSKRSKHSRRRARPKTKTSLWNTAEINAIQADYTKALQSQKHVKPITLTQKSKNQDILWADLPEILR